MLNAILPSHRQGGWRPERQGATAMDTKLRCDTLAHAVRALAVEVSGLEQQAARLQRMLAEHEQREVARTEVCWCLATLVLIPSEMRAPSHHIKRLSANAVRIPAHVWLLSACGVAVLPHNEYHSHWSGPPRLSPS